jgi:tetratricopeptide (TPR) repeat protein
MDDIVEAKLVDLSARVGPMSEVKGEPATEAREVFRRQALLLDLEISNFIEKHRMTIRQGGIRRFSDRLKIATQAFAVLSGLAIAVALCSMVVAAVRSQAVVVDTFDSPSALADRGLTGTVVAGRVLDQLTTLKAATRTAAARRKTTNAWSQDIKVQVPQTGISLGEIDRLLRARLGRDTHIGGDLVKDPDGQLSLTVRGDGLLPKTFTGPEADLEKLATSAAEYIYGTSEPVLFASYLSQRGRSEEALAFMAQTYPTLKPADRPDMLNAWGLTLQAGGKPADAVVRFRQALQLNPRTWKAWANLTGALGETGDYEAAYRSGLDMLKESARAPAGEKMPLRYGANFYPLVQNWTDLIRASVADGSGSARTTADSNGPLIADAEARRHNWAEADRALLASEPDELRTQYFKLGVGARRALAVGDSARAIALTEAQTKAFGESFGIDITAGRAYLAAGRLKEAQAAFDGAGADPEMLGYAAEIPEAAGDWPAAQAAFAKAVAARPSLPFAYHRWGLALMRHGDLAGAAAKFAMAQRQGPNWADPFKAHGDVLAAQRRWPEAIVKYAKAEPLAPRWEELHRAWAAALKASGDANGAASHLQLAEEIKAQTPRTIGPAT